MEFRSRAVAWTTIPESCFVRYTRMPPRIVREALDWPASQRLFPRRVAYYVDREHLHYSAHPRGITYVRAYLLVSGSGTIRLGERFHHVTAGSVFVIPPMVPFFGQPSRAGWSLWHCDLDGTDVAGVFSSAGIDVDRPHLRPVDPKAIAAVFQQLADECAVDYSPARLLAAVGVTWALVTRLAADSLSIARRGPLDRAIDYLDHHLADDIRVPDLALAVGLSAARLQRLFHDALGTGIHAYQIGLRMDRARQLLATTEQSIAYVARAVGYADSAYFSRHFREVNGTTPTDYRLVTSRIPG